MLGLNFGPTKPMNVFASVGGLGVVCLLVINLYDTVRHGASLQAIRKEQRIGFQQISRLNPACEYMNNTALESTESKMREKAYLEYVDDKRKRLNEKTKRLPDVIGIGVEKCGTDALRQILTRNPLIISSQPSELHYFDHPEKYKKGIQNYISMMPDVAVDELAMEKSPAYFFGHDDVLQRMKAAVPNVKLLVVLCDPVNRTFSDFAHEIAMSVLPKNADYDQDMSSAVEIMSSSMKSLHNSLLPRYVVQTMRRSTQLHIIAGGLYYYHLQRWFKVFKRDQLLIIDGESLMKTPWDVAQEVQDFLGVPRLVVKDDFARNRETGFYHVGSPTLVEEGNRRTVLPGNPICKRLKTKGRTRNGAWGYKPKESTVKAIREFYKPHNEKLYKLIGKRFKWQ